MNIQKVEEGKEKHINLLLEADPQIELINKYISDGDMYIGILNDEVICEVVVTKVNNDECELKNIATLEKFRGKGYATQIIKYVFEEYKKKYKRIIVGTSENMIPFYVLNGFTKYHHTVKNFFIDNYKQKIWDGNLQCIDMYYYYKELSE